MRVLVVDDNHFQLRIVKASLKRSGVELDAAVHGRESVELFEKRLQAIRDVGFDDAENRLATKPPYDVILMDSMMPVMDGCAATIEIRAAERAFRATLPAALLKPGGTFERETMIILHSAEVGPGRESAGARGGLDGAGRAVPPRGAAGRAAAAQPGHLQLVEGRLQARDAALLDSSGRVRGDFEKSHFENVSRSDSERVPFLPALNV